MPLRRLQEKTIGDFVPVKVLESEKSKNPQPKQYDEKREDAIRKLITANQNYAESGPTFDPSGRYLCGSCVYRTNDNARNPCAVVQYNVSNTTGSCQQYFKGRALGSKLSNFPKDSVALAQYAERPKSKGFGCSRCEYAEKANQTDSAGRSLWCNEFGCRVLPAACCRKEDGPDLIVPGSKK